MISISPADGIPGYILTNDETGEDRLIDLDWDYPGLASTFGASPRVLVPVLLRDGGGRSLGRCRHEQTDGTIRCPACGTEPGTFIAAAAAYLNDGPDPVEDPGYFDCDE